MLELMDIEFTDLENVYDSDDSDDEEAPKKEEIPLKFNKRALEGFLHGLHSLRKPEKTAKAPLLKLTGSEVLTSAEIQEVFRNIRDPDFVIEWDDDRYFRLKGYLYALWMNKTTMTKTFEKIQKLTKIFTRKDVKIMFEKFKKGKESLMEKDVGYEDDGEKFDLMGLFPEIKEKVVEFLDVESRLSVRKSCRQLRHFVDNGHVTIKKLTIIRGRSSQYFTDDGLKVMYRGSQNYPYSKANIFKNDKIVRTIKATLNPFLYVWQNEAMILFESFKKLRIDHLDLRIAVFRDFVESDYKPKPLDESSQLSSRIKVRHLSIRTHALHVLADALPLMDSDELERVRVTFWEKEEECYEEGDYEDGVEYRKRRQEEMFQMEHWKRIKVFETDRYVLTDNISEHFAHFEVADFDLVGNTSVKEILKLKENLLKNPRLHQLLIRKQLTKKEFTALNRHFKTHNVWKSKKEVFAHFQYPKSQGTLSLAVKDNYILFNGPKFEEIEYEDENEVDFEDDSNDLCTIPLVVLLGRR